MPQLTSPPPPLQVPRPRRSPRAIHQVVSPSRPRPPEQNAGWVWRRKQGFAPKMNIVLIIRPPIRVSITVLIYSPSCCSQGATAVCTFALCMGLGQPVLFFSGECAGNVVPPRPRIDQSKPGIASRSVSPLPALCDPEFSVAAGAVFGWDPIFEPVEGQVAGQPAQVSCLPRRAQSFFDALLFRLVFLMPAREFCFAATDFRGDDHGSKSGNFAPWTRSAFAQIPPPHPCLTRINRTRRSSLMRPSSPASVLCR